MFSWTPEMVRFMEDASEYCSYHETLAKCIADEIPQKGTICDAGCGLGYLSLALAKRFPSVTAVDCSPEALAVLRRKMAERGIGNITVREGDAETLSPAEPYDAMVFCFFGSTEEILRIGARQCRGKVIVFKKNWDEHRFTIRRTRLGHETFSIMKEKLEKLGIPYEARTFETEMGQPFRNFEDAVRFFKTYNREAPGEVTPEEVEKRLVRTDSPEFPFYLPQEKRMGMFVLDLGDFPDTI